MQLLLFALLFAIKLSLCYGHLLLDIKDVLSLYTVNSEWVILVVNCKFYNGYFFGQDYGSSTTECVREDLSDEVGDVEVEDLKQEPDEAC